MIKSGLLHILIIQTDITKKAVKNILSTGTPVLNQAVLMKGIDDLISWKI